MRGLACLAVLLAVHLAGAARKSASLPGEFQRCTRNDVTCLKEAVMKAFPVLSKGMPKLGIMPIDPLQVTEMFIGQGSGPVTIELTLKNQDIFGIGHAVIKNIRSDMTDETYMIGIEATIPTLVFRGDYTIAGKILLLPIQGQGKNNLTLNNVDVNLVLKGEVVDRNAEKFVDVDYIAYTFETSRLYIELGNLFGGDPVLGNNMVVFLNENWRTVLDELKPSIQVAMSTLLKKVASSIYSNIPYDVLHIKA